MLSLVLGIAGFILYLLYDINSFTSQNRLLGYGFLGGSVLITISTVIELIGAFKQNAFGGAADIILILLSVVSFAMLIYCLFFALPFEETYVEQTNGRKVYDGGAYALCRHPGIICFFAFYLFLGLAALPSKFLAIGMIFSLLNLLYAAFQDRVTFPKCFTNYVDYRKKVPFLIPNKKSIRQAAQTWARSDGKDDIT
ncbi:MAG: hypothetical protein IKU80_04125 [Firmicutes bacterium]|nr:hypothetical protein [Bacillota bacterium]